VYIVIQVEEEGLYKVAVTSMHDTPSFGPDLPHPPFFRADENLREFLLTKSTLSFPCYLLLY